MIPDKIELYANLSRATVRDSHGLVIVEVKLPGSEVIGFNSVSYAAGIVEEGVSFLDPFFKSFDRLVRQQFWPVKPVTDAGFVAYEDIQNRGVCLKAELFHITQNKETVVVRISVRGEAEFDYLDAGESYRLYKKAVDLESHPTYEFCKQVSELFRNQFSAYLIPFATKQK